MRLLILLIAASVFCGPLSAQKLDGDNLYSLLNQSANSEAVRQFRTAYGTSLYRKSEYYQKGDGDYWSSKDGIEYNLTKGRVANITMRHHHPTLKFQPFTGTLPQNLRWGMSKNEIIDALGGDGYIYHYDLNQDLRLYYDKTGGAEVLKAVMVDYFDYSVPNIFSATRDPSKFTYLKSGGTFPAANPSSPDPFASRTTVSSAAAGADLCSGLTSIITAARNGGLTELAGKSLPGAESASVISSKRYTIILRSGQEANASTTEAVMEEWSKKIEACLPNYEHGHTVVDGYTAIADNWYHLSKPWFKLGDIELIILQQKGAGGKTDVALTVIKQ